MIKINAYDSISYRNAHEMLSDRLNQITYGIATNKPILTLTSKTIDGNTYYRWKIDFVDADKIFGKCEYPIELLIRDLAYEFSINTGEIFTASQPYWDYDTANKFVRSISFILINPDLDADDCDIYDNYVDYNGFNPVLLYAHK